MLGTAWMSDGTDRPPYSQTPYKLTTSTISSITLQSQWLNEHQWSTGGQRFPDGGYPQTWVPFFDNDPATFYSISPKKHGLTLTTPCHQQARGFGCGCRPELTSGWMIPRFKSAEPMRVKRSFLHPFPKVVLMDNLSG